MKKFIEKAKNELTGLGILILVFSPLLLILIISFSQCHREYDYTDAGSYEYAMDNPKNAWIEKDQEKQKKESESPTINEGDTYNYYTYNYYE